MTVAAIPSLRDEMLNVVDPKGCGSPRPATCSEVLLLLSAAEIGGFALAVEIAERARIRCPGGMAAIAREMGIPGYIAPELGAAGRGVH